MVAISWGTLGSRVYNSGVDRGVIYPKNSPGVSWSGLVSVEEDETGIIEPYYLDGVKYMDFVATQDFTATVNAFTYPDALLPYIVVPGVNTIKYGGVFDFCYRTLVSSDQADLGYRLHLVYNATLTPMQFQHSTRGADTGLEAFSWKLTTREEPVPNAKASSHLVVDSRSINSAALKLLEDQLYGTPNFAPFMPRPDEVKEIALSTAGFAVVDHGNGRWSFFGPDSAIQMLDDTTFQINWSSLTYSDANTYTVTST